MGDITKCKGRDCPLRESCHRFTAPAHEYRQAYFMTEPIEDNPEGLADCGQWIDNGNDPNNTGRYS